jgi:hypothetical protein
MTHEVANLLSISVETVDIDYPDCELVSSSKEELIIKKEGIMFFNPSCLILKYFKSNIFGSWIFNKDNSSWLSTAIEVPITSFMDKKEFTDMYLIPNIREENFITLMPSKFFSLNIVIEIKEKSKPPLIEID